ncbi:hypothetical protein OAM69_01625 [bacterium]|nr:hypothetical protein [bacterium]
MARLRQVLYTWVSGITEGIRMTLTIIMLLVLALPTAVQLSAMSKIAEYQGIL